jgi:hypothetical protein
MTAKCLDPDCQPQTSHKTIYKAPDTAVRDEGKGSSLAEMRNAVDGGLVNRLMRASLSK